MQFCPNQNPPCYMTKEEDVVIQAEDEIRLKIVGTRVDATGIVSINQTPFQNTSIPPSLNLSSAIEPRVHVLKLSAKDLWAHSCIFADNFQAHIRGSYGAWQVKVLVNNFLWQFVTHKMSALSFKFAPRIAYSCRRFVLSWKWVFLATDIKTIFSGQIFYYVSIKAYKVIWFLI